jgi:hypothetical protein
MTGQWLMASINEELIYEQNIREGFNSVSKMRDSFNKWLDSQGDKSSWSETRFGRSMTQLLGKQERPYIEKIRARGYELNPTLLREKVLTYTKRPDLFYSE